MGSEMCIRDRVSYDCWIEAAEGANPAYGWASHSSWREADIDRCKAEFEAAMSTLEGMTYFRLTEFRKPPSGMAMPAPVAPQVAAAPELSLRPIRRCRRRGSGRRSGAPEGPGP